MVVADFSPELLLSSCVDDDDELPDPELLVLELLELLELVLELELLLESVLLVLLVLVLCALLELVDRLLLLLLMLLLRWLDEDADEPLDPFRCP